MDNTKLCPFCNQEINAEATRCKYCKKWLEEPEQKPRKFLETVLLSWFLGVYGAHRFYTGYYLIGFIQLFTLGGLGIWSMIDFISICLGNYEDAKGNKLLKYNPKTGLLILFVNILLFLFILVLIMAFIMLISLNVKGH